MTPDQGPSHFNPSLPEIPWPTEVTPEDLEGIAKYRRENKSLAASVAQVILNKTESLLTQYDTEEDEIYYLMIMAYRRPSFKFLEMEDYIRTGGDFVLGEQEEAFAGILEVLGADINETIWTQTISTAAAEIYAMDGTFAGILKREGPLKFIDFFVDYEIGIISKSRNPEGARLLKPPRYLELGRQRFRQLYEAAQEAGLS